jgi:hypothetical protein
MTHLVPAEAGLTWQQNTLTSLRAGDSAFAKEEAMVLSSTLLRCSLSDWCSSSLSGFDTTCGWEFRGCLVSKGCCDIVTACDIHLLIVTHHAVNAPDPFQANDHDPKVGVQPLPRVVAT